MSASQKYDINSRYAESMVNGHGYPLPVLPRTPGDTLSIAELGALGDGLTDNTVILQQAIDRCSAEGGGCVLIPPGIWRTGPLRLRSHVRLHAAAGALVLFEPDPAVYPILPSHYEGQPGPRCQAPLEAEGATDIAITGEGIFDGNGQAWRPVKRAKLTAAAWEKLLASGGALSPDGELWWPSEEGLHGERRLQELRGAGVEDCEAYEPVRAYLRPSLLRFRSCSRILLEGPTFQNSPAWCLHLQACDQVTIRHIQVRNPWYSQNGDGLDLDSCRHALVTHCAFDVGDDAICLKSGKDEAGRLAGLPCEYITIRDCTVYHGHGGFVIGSEMSGDVRAVRVSDCTFIGTDIGLRFKSARGRGGIIEDISIRRVRMSNIVYEGISFHMFYAGTEGSAGSDDAPVAVDEGTPQCRNIAIHDVLIQDAETALLLNGLPEQPLKDIRIDGLTARARQGIICRHATDVRLDRLALHGEAAGDIRLHRCTGVTGDGIPQG
ncbi:glycoside hydrolase family 28 protein [Paenibacillus daejeonensis]|uniref:glycoside hydrolase family 28 protein n=1 Tax=Paenibacillus daejeonensis TaxID=135193 RepID=UPI00037FC281|nr:glycoside hydrolase family 28 protein [Paenibacillus daejeonensis]